MRLPRDISPGAAARRSLLADCGAAITIALLTLQLAAGIGVVAVFAVVVLLILLVSIGVETAVRKGARRRALRRKGSAKSPSAPSLRS